MSTQTNVLYGNRLYDQETYSDNQDPQTFNANLSDTASLTDTRIDTITQILTDLSSLLDTRTITGEKLFSDSTTLTDSVAKIITAVKADSMTLSDARVIATITQALSELITMSEVLSFSDRKIISDSLTLVESVAKTLSHSFSDSMSLSDSEAQKATKALHEALSILETAILTIGTKALTETITMTESRVFKDARILVDALAMLNLATITGLKGMPEFIILNEWLSIKLQKAEIWTITSAANPNAGDLTEYDKPLYDIPPYSGKRETIWQQTPEDTTTWAVPVGELPSAQLYSQFLYAPVLYGGSPIRTWIVPPADSEENFTNFDGEGNVP